MQTFNSKLASLGLGVALLAASASAFADRAVLTQTFNGPGLPDQWMTTNNSTPGGIYSWSKSPTPTVAFDAQSGPADSYYRDTFDAAGFGGNVSDWLFTPVVTMYAGDILTFYTRTELDFFPGDGLQVRLSTSGSSTNVGSTTASLGDFSTLLLNLASLSDSWTQYTVALSGFSGAVTGRLAFRYVVTNTATSGDVVGLDTISLTSAVPEPATPLTMAIGFAALAAIVRRRNKQN